MITDNQIVKIGVFLKPHGIKGEINFETEFELDVASLKCLILKVDGINVPFFVDSIRERSAQAYLILIDGINSDSAAKELCGQDVFALKVDVEEFTDFEEDGDRIFLTDLIGYGVVLNEGDSLGKVDAIDDSTENVLLLVKSKTDKERIIMIPVVDDFIEEIDSETKTIRMNLPKGLVELND